jgi:hypothetical protein
MVAHDPVGCGFTKEGQIFLEVITNGVVIARVADEPPVAFSVVILAEADILAINSGIKTSQIA